MLAKLLPFAAATCLLTACAKTGGSEAPTTSSAEATDSTYYQEAYRPQVHFSPASGWMNDPNGLIQVNGVFHLFYQHYPDSTVWGPMHWGHAVSEDLVHWTHKPIALYPDSLGYIFSGSIAYDELNTSGLGSLEEPPMVAVFTYHDMPGEQGGRKDYQSQGIAYSLDEGETWKKYANNPVIPNPGDVPDFRDPKVIYHEASERWIMALAIDDVIAFYSSPNLIDWTRESDMRPTVESPKRPWECPDLFPIQVTDSGTAEGRPGEEKYVLLVSVQDDAPNGGTGTSYLVGDFDGETFTPTDGVNDPLWLDYGTDNYALVTWDNVARLADNYRLGVGWMSNWLYSQTVPTDTWRSAMTAPRRLSLYETPEGMRLRTEIVAAYDELEEEKFTIEHAAGATATAVLPQNEPSALPARLHVSGADDAAPPPFTLSLAGAEGDTLRIGYDAAAGEYFVDRSALATSDFYEGFAARHTAERKAYVSALQLDEAMPGTVDLLLDRASVELIADDGFTVMTEVFFLEGGLVSAEVSGPEALTVEGWGLESALVEPVEVVME